MHLSSSTTHSEQICQVSAYEGVVAIPGRPHTMINFTAATYYLMGEAPEISYNKFRKFCDFGARRAKEALQEDLGDKDGAEGGSKPHQVCGRKAPVRAH